MAQQNVFLKLNPDSKETTSVTDDTITFTSIQNEESESFQFHCVFQEEIEDNDINSLILDPICENSLLGVSSTILLYGNENVSSANITLFQHILPKLQQFLQEHSTNLIDISVLDGAMNLPVEQIQDIELYNISDSNNDKIISINIHQIDSTKDSSITSKINVLLLASCNDVSRYIHLHSKDTSTWGKLLKQVLSKDNDMFIFLHCMITPVNQSEVLAIFQNVISFMARYENQHNMDITALNQSKKQNNLVGSYSVLNKCYTSRIDSIESELNNLENSELEPENDEDKLQLKLKLSEENNNKIRAQIDQMKQLLTDSKENSDILDAYMNKATTYHYLLSEIGNVENKNKIFTQANSLVEKYSNILTQNQNSLNKLFKSQSEQEFQLQQENVDLKLQTQEIKQSNKSLDEKISKLQMQQLQQNHISLYQTSSSLMSPSSLISSTHSHKNSISSTNSSLSSNITSDLESTAHAKNSHLPLSINSGFQLKVLRPK
ncbi:component of the polarisome [Maudiozyma exigua]|uniref:Component of the polarisome n=1 Tax=Maudiozyma exigua TaxID=34358 RepID=A0A9P6WF56_MAUEX|nr:component of the polarisome [Kazachstania exigua]